MRMPVAYKTALFMAIFSITAQPAPSFAQSGEVRACLCQIWGPDVPSSQELPAQITLDVNMDCDDLNTELMNQSADGEYSMICQPVLRLGRL